MKAKLLGKCAAGVTLAAIFLAGDRFAPSSHAQAQPDNQSVEAATLPPYIPPSSPLAQVIWLIQSDVDESVILAYIANSTSLFNLDSDEIIYLKDIGAPNSIVNMMIQRDQVLKTQMAVTAPPPDSSAGYAPEVAPPAQPTEVTVNYFYDTLSPYGTWVEIPDYGWCWRPTVVLYSSAWQPYGDHGHWVYTDCGWYWISDYSWGWAAFHYGRWFHHPRWGWCWWPDTIWAPSWVYWRYSDDYCGWAPLPPRCYYRQGVGLIYNGAVVSGGFDFGLSVSCFTFVPTRDFCDLHPWRHRVEAREVTQIYNHTTVINNLGVNHTAIINNGIPPQRIAAVTGIAIHPVSIHDTTGPVPRGEQLGRDGQTLMVSRPHFVTNAGSSPNSGFQSPHPAPASNRIQTPMPNHNYNYDNNGGFLSPRLQLLDTQTLRGDSRYEDRVKEPLKTPSVPSTVEPRNLPPPPPVPHNYAGPPQPVSSGPSGQGGDKSGGSQGNQNKGNDSPR